MGSAPLHLVFGATGQVGFELVRELSASGRVVGLSRPELDLERPETIRDAVRTYRPAFIWNAAAATAVDALEDDPDLAFRVNATAPGVLAEEAKHTGASLVHFSTDYVFDGRKADPYHEDDPPNPLNVYGRSKLAGEHAIRAASGSCLILRTSWVYSSRGRNFLRTIVGRGTQSDSIRVVSDQVGVPTWSRELARASVRVLERYVLEGGPVDLVHLVPDDSCSWYEFACEIRRQAGLLGLTWHAEIQPVSTREFGARAPRPGYSVLSNARARNNYGVLAESWRSILQQLLTDPVERERLWATAT